MIITFNIPDDKAQDIIDLIARTTGWTAGSNMTKAQWAKQIMAQEIKSMLTRNRHSEVMQQAESYDNLDIT